MRGPHLHRHRATPSEGLVGRKEHAQMPGTAPEGKWAEWVGIGKARPFISAPLLPSFSLSLIFPHSGQDYRTAAYWNLSVNTSFS